MKADRDELIPTRASLLKRLKDWQDQSSWQEFFDIYWKLIYSVARKPGLVDAEAQDVVQETMAAVARHMPSFKYDPAIGSFKAWLLKLTRWRVIDQIRKRGRFVPLHRFPDDTTRRTELANAAARTVDAVWDTDWELNLLEVAKSKVKRRIDPEKYQIFDFYVNREWPPEKVATTFGVSVANVYVIKHRVTEAIREEVERLEREMT